MDDFAAKRQKSFIDYELDEFKKSKKLGEDLLSLAKVLLAVKATSTDIERVFSTCGIIVTKRRNKLGTKLLNAIIVIKLN